MDESAERLSQGAGTDSGFFFRLVPCATSRRFTGPDMATHDGGPEKCALLPDELGFDAAIDYRADGVGKALRRHAPDGIDVYFDNVGGDILDAALTRLAMHARVVVCGAISQYDNATPVKGPSNYLTLLVRRARMEGFVVFDYAKRYPQAAQDISAWITDGRIKVKEHVVRGSVDDFPEMLQMLFRGENVGKLVLELA